MKRLINVLEWMWTGVCLAAVLCVAGAWWVYSKIRRETMTEETYVFHIAITKPKASKCWTVMLDSKGAPILGVTPVKVEERGRNCLPYYIGPNNNIQDPADWEVRAARVVL